MAKNIMDAFIEGKVWIRLINGDTLPTDQILAFDMLGIVVDIGERVFVPWGSIRMISAIEDPDA